MTILYFTSTGNSLQVAKYLNGENTLSIPQLIKSGNYTIEDEVIGIVTPCYCGGLPLIVQRFLASAKLRCSYLFAVITYGDMLALAPLQLEKTAVGCGYKFQYINSIHMTDNYLPLYEITDQLAKLPQKEVAGHLEEIKNDISNHKQFIPKTSIISRIFGGIMQSSAKKSIGGEVDTRFRIDSHCIKCGTCVRVCPVDNIELTQKPGFLHHCEGCLGCIHHCPVGALHVDKEKSVARFCNSEVTLEEIIESNG